VARKAQDWVVCYHETQATVKPSVGFINNQSVLTSCTFRALKCIRRNYAKFVCLIRKKRISNVPRVRLAGLILILSAYVIWALSKQTTPTQCDIWV
jgi:hypothetical protein